MQEDRGQGRRTQFVIAVHTVTVRRPCVVRRRHTRRMLTSSARRSVELRHRATSTVRRLASVGQSDPSRATELGQVRAGRWQRFGRAIVLHNGVPTRAEQFEIALVNLGPRAALTAFTALEAWGLAGWERDAVHVLVPRGARIRRPAGLDVRVHYTDQWSSAPRHDGRGLHRPANSAVIAASTFRNPRPACAILAAVVQQRLARPGDLVAAVSGSPRVRHRAAMLAAANDVAQGAHALAEIDFARLCRSAGLPTPKRQGVRRDSSGRRRYLDVEWDLPDGRRLVVEVDGALHLAVGRWWDDQLRQNELTLSGDIVLRFPSVVVRCEPHVVIAQLHRILAPIFLRR